MTPSEVTKQIHILEKAQEAITKSMEAVRSLCSHEGCVNFYPDTYDSVWMCEACGRFWIRKPGGV